MKSTFATLAALALLGGCTQVKATEDAGVDQAMIDRMAISLHEVYPATLGMSRG